MEKQELFIKIENYLDGKMPEAEAKTFEADIATDPVLAESVALHRLVFNGRDAGKTGHHGQCK